MAAFPFAQMPTFGEFLHVARDEYGCDYRVSLLHLIGPDGASKLSVMSRSVDGHTWEATLPRLANDDRLTPHVLQSLCVRLGIDAQRFNLTL